MSQRFERKFNLDREGKLAFQPEIVWFYWCFISADILEILLNIHPMRQCFQNWLKKVYDLE